MKTIEAVKTLQDLQETDRSTLGVEEAAAIMGISRGAAYSAARAGDLPGALRVGGRVLVATATLRRALGIEPS